MSSRLQITIFITFLVAIGLGLTIYKAAYLGFPLTPGEKQKIWSVEATVDFVADGKKPVKVSLALPDIQDNYAMIDERSSSPDYGASYSVVDGVRRIEWAKREAHGRRNSTIN